MGLNLLGSSFSSNDGYQRQSSIEPDPMYFQIEQVQEVGLHVVAIVRYPNATNFEGRKILVFKDMSEEYLRNIKRLDPHFSRVGPSPFARFIPTEEGLAAAITLCNYI